MKETKGNIVKHNVFKNRLKRRRKQIGNKQKF